MNKYLRKNRVEKPRESIPSTVATVYAGLEQLVGIVRDVDDRMLLQNLDELLQLLEVGLHPRLPLPFVEGVREEGKALVGLVHQRPVTTQSLHHGSCLWSDSGYKGVKFKKYI